MVVDQLTDDEVDRLFHALADATRRDILEVTLDGTWSVSALARRYPMSFAAVQKHVATLERAGLVRKEKHGREQLVRTEVDAIRIATALLERYEQQWRDRVGRMDELLAEPTAAPATDRTPATPDEGDQPCP
jgi:DNA-binding transcriptional ArsR family regulator